MSEEDKKEQLNPAIKKEVDKLAWQNAHSSNKLAGVWEILQIKEGCRISVSIEGTCDIEYGMGYNNKIRFAKAELSQIYQFLKSQKRARKF